MKNLKQFNEGSVPVLVASNLGSRGIDFDARVTHVVQYEFASNRIDHLHRIGRTGRAGAPGRVTNFYDESDKELVEAIQEIDGHGQQHDIRFKKNLDYWRPLNPKH